MNTYIYGDLQICISVTLKTKLLTLMFPSAAMFINIYKRAHVIRFERFSCKEVATAQLPCESDINI